MIEVTLAVAAICLVPLLNGSERKNLMKTGTLAALSAWCTAFSVFMLYKLYHPSLHIIVSLVIAVAWMRIFGMFFSDRYLTVFIFLNALAGYSVIDPIFASSTVIMQIVAVPTIFMIYLVLFFHLINRINRVVPNSMKDIPLMLFITGLIFAYVSKL